MLKDNLHKVQTQIAEALSRRTETKLTGDKVTLVAVTKNHPVDVVLESLALGVTNIGENRVQEAKEKRTIVPDRGFWHLIGHLQTNKAKQAVTLFDLIESADSKHLWLRWTRRLDSSISSRIFCCSSTSPARSRRQDF